VRLLAIVKTEDHFEGSQGPKAMKRFGIDINVSDIDLFKQFMTNNSVSVLDNVKWLRFALPGIVI
jgi:hypothetical protein